MQSKILSKRILLIIVVLTGITFFSALLFHFLPKSSTQGELASIIKNATALPEQEQARFGLPMRLKIPSIDVDALVEYVGLTPNGAMDVPKERANVAWFDLGPRPGASGSAVIAGHYGWKDGEESVFDDLYKLRKGDKIYAEDDKGEVISFVVRESRRYDPNEDALEVFGSNDGKAHLNLVTCEGVWDESTQQYSERLVVFTDKE